MPALERCTHPLAKPPPTLAQRALAESPMNICGIPIKQLNLVEDRADYYKHRHQAAQSALVQALQTLALLGNDGQAAAAALAAAPALAPQAPAPPPAMDLGELAALLSLESAQNAQMNAAARPQVRRSVGVLVGWGGQCGRGRGDLKRESCWSPAPHAVLSPASPIAAAVLTQAPPASHPPVLQPFPMHQPMNMAGMNAYAEPRMAPRYSSGNLPPFANLPGFSQAGMTAQAPAGLAMPAAQPAYMAAPPAAPAFPPASAAALAAALAGPMGGAPAPRLHTGASSPFSTLDAQAHPSAASSPPKGELVGLPAGLPLVQPRSSLGSGSSGSASPDLDAAAGVWLWVRHVFRSEGMRVERALRCAAQPVMPCWPHVQGC